MKSSFPFPISKTLVIAATVLSVLPLLACSPATESESRESSVLTRSPRQNSRLDLRTEEEPGTGLRISRGTFAVYEDREARSGRMIHLGVVILHAKGPNRKPDPVFPFAGGPGRDVTTTEAGYRDSWMRDERDIVLVAQRGTGGDNKLDCPKAADDGNIQGYLEPLFRTDLFRDCREELSKKFDLTKYSTELAADDVNDLCRALGYDTINVMGGSYGTRMALVYMRRHPETVRTAVLNGVAPIAFRNPLYHAPNFHEAIRALFAECANDPECRAEGEDGERPVPAEEPHHRRDQPDGGHGEGEA